MKDALGNEIRVDDRVAWGVKGAIRIGVVTEVDVPYIYGGQTRYMCRVRGSTSGPGGLFGRVVRVLEPSPQPTGEIIDP